jgi:FAD-dependent oxidoreductase domain-containing protein 1
MAERCDVLIVGGAVMGSAIAYFLAEAGLAGRVTVIERDPGYAHCATTRSWGGVRQQFSTAENIRMSAFGVEFIRGIPDRLAVDGERPDPGFREQGYLFLASPEGLPVLEANCRLQRELGAATELLTPDSLAARFPWLNLDGIAGAGFGPRDEGWIDPHALLNALRRKARSLGVAYRRDEVIALRPAGNRIDRIELAGGEILSAGTVVIAAGPQSGAVAALAGIELPVSPRKRSSFVFDCRTDLGRVPLTVDPTGVAFRPEGRQYIAIVSPPPDQDPDSDDLEPDYALFEERIWPVLAHRVPAFEAIKPGTAWGGHYDYNRFDQNAVLGPHPAIDNLLFCTGFSGHGLQQAPAAGRAVAEWILHGAYRSIDLSRFGYQRIAENRPLPEINVV